MKNDYITTLLLDLGLSENESKTYLSALSLGPTTALTIARTAGIRRTTVYSTIETLKTKGLIHIEPRGMKNVFVAEHPEKLESMLEMKRNSLHKVLPELSALYNLKGTESTIKYYEGLPAIKTIYDTILDPLTLDDYYYVIGDLQKFFDMDRPYFEAFIQKRIQTGILAKIIATESEQTDYMKKFSKNMSHEVRILPKGSKLSVDVMINPYKVSIFNLREPLSAISIENKDTIEMQKELFEIIWNSLPA